MNAAKRYIISCSFGKDSLATILLAKKHGEPLDEAVYCEVMFDKTISGEVPEHRDFIYTRGIPALELSRSVHRANHPRPQKGNAALFPHLRAVCRPA